MTTEGISHAVSAAVKGDGQEASGGRLLLGWALIGLAVIFLVAGWIGVSGDPRVAVQLSYFLSGGFGGLLSGIVGVGLLVSDDMRRDRARLGRLEAAVLEVREILVAQASILEGIEQRAKAERATTDRRAVR